MILYVLINVKTYTDQTECMCIYSQIGTCFMLHRGKTMMAVGVLIKVIHSDINFQKLSLVYIEYMKNKDIPLAFNLSPMQKLQQHYNGAILESVKVRQSLMAWYQIYLSIFHVIYCMHILLFKFWKEIPIKAHKTCKRFKRATSVLLLIAL